MPSISVIIPAYNADRTILETIESVQNQTFTDFEIIVINDGSTDRTLEVLQSVSDDRLKIFTYENSGASTARNRGFDCAAGEYLTFIDADDLWAPDKLELQLAALREHPEAGVAYSWTIFMQEEKDGSRSLHAGEPVLHQGDVHAELLICNFIASGSNILMRKQLIDQVGLFDTNLARTEDWDYYLRLAANSSFIVVPKLQIYYRRSSNSKSSNVSKVKEGCLTVLDKAYRSAPKELQHLKPRSLAWVYRYCTDVALRGNADIKGVQQAGRDLYQSIKFEPISIFNEYTQSLLRWFLKRWFLLRFASPVRK